MKLKRKVKHTEELVHEEHDFHGVINTEDIKYGYCTEMMVRFGKDKRAFDEQTFRTDMSQFGDSLLVINDDEIVKVHVHTETPGEVFNYGQEYGELIKLKVENMREQHREVIRKEKLNHHSDEQEESKQLRLPLSRFQWVMVFLNYLHLWVRHIS